MIRPVAGDDRGSVTVFVVLFVGALFAFGGLVIDGGRAITNRQHAADLAAQASRAGVNALDASQIRGHAHDYVDTAAVQTAACALVTAANPADVCVAVASANTVTVTVTSKTTTTLLGIVGINTFTGKGSATARSARGYTSEVTG